MSVIIHTLLFLFSIFYFLSSAVADWPMFRGNALRTGFSLGASCLNGPDSVLTKWEFHAPAPITFSSPAVGNINADSFLEVVIGCDDYNLYALRADSGKFLWSYPTGSYIQSSPLLIDLDGDSILEVVFASFDCRVYAVDGQGNFLWSYTTGNWIFSSPVGGDIDLDDTIEIVIGSFDDWVYVLNGVTGNLEWKYKTGGDIYSSPALGDMNGDDTLEVVIGSDDRKLYVLQNGDTLWTHTSNNQIRSTPAIGDLDGDSALDVCFGDGVFSGPSGYIYGLDGQSGALLWTPINIGWLDRASPGLADIDGDSLLEIIIGSGGNELLYAIEGESGLIKWAINPSSPTSWMIRTSPAIANIDSNSALEIVLGTHDFYCTTVDSGGAIFWKYWVAGDPHSGPAIANVDRDSALEVIIGTLAGDVFCLDCKRRSGVEEIDYRLQDYRLQIKPNPFAQNTEIRIQKPNTRGQKSELRIEIYDLGGRVIRTFPITPAIDRRDNYQSPITSITWDGRDFQGNEVKNGIYFCKLKVGNGDWGYVCKLIRIR